MIFDLYKPNKAVSLELKIEVLYYIARDFSEHGC